MKLKYFMLATLALLLTACGGKSEKEGIKPETTTISGNMGDYFKLVDKTYPSLTKEESSVSIEFKRNDKAFEDGAEVTKSKVTVEFLDEEGNVVCEEDADASSIMKLGGGETGAVEVEASASEDDLKKITSFKVSGLIEFAENAAKTYTLTGNVGKYPVEMVITIDGKAVAGKYRYTSSGNGDFINFFGECEDGKISFTEEYEGKITGTWNFNIYDSTSPVTAMGTMTNYKGDSYDIRLEGEIGGEPLAMSQAAVATVEVAEPAVSADSGDIDSLLDAYEKAISIYIALLKKSQRGDASVLADMQEAMEEYMEIAVQLDNVSGTMSEAQLQRMTNIAAKVGK
ncbi:MAG: hypothetical protein NC217_06950 [Muribaculaceae bacterium]|nr:hypothetical protein [Muribaculaceae bacterium]